MKKVFVFIIVMMVINISFGQKITEFYGGVLLRKKFEISKKEIPNPNILDRPLGTELYFNPYF